MVYYVGKDNKIYQAVYWDKSRKAPRLDWEVLSKWIETDDSRKTVSPVHWRNWWTLNWTLYNSLEETHTLTKTKMLAHCVKQNPHLFKTHYMLEMRKYTYLTCSLVNKHNKNMNHTFFTVVRSFNGRTDFSRFPESFDDIKFCSWWCVQSF